MSGTNAVTMALVGCGGIAQAHWRGIGRVAPQVKVTAVVDTDPVALATMAERTGAPAFASLSEALAQGDFDTVDLMLPHDLHEEAAIQCFQAGKHVVLEKPMSMDIDSCERILAAAKQAGTVFMIAEQSQYWPEIARARELIAAGAIGQVIGARGSYRDSWPRDPGSPKPWRYYLKHCGGGLCIDGGAHWIRPLRMMLGEVDSVIAATSRPVVEMEGETQAHAILRFASGITASFDAWLTDCRPARYEAFRITGMLGELVIEMGRDGHMLLIDRQHPAGEVVMSVGSSWMDSYGLQLHDFSLAVLEGKPLAASAEYSLGELRTALAIYRSVATGNWEKVW